MFSNRSTRWLAALTAVCALALPACGGSSGSSSSGGGGGGATPSNLAPFLGCVKGAITAGGPRILVLWDEATDDNDLASAIRYNVYLSATSGGHNFAAPVATSAPGATSMQLTNANSPLIAVGAEVFVVVRAVDSGGLENENLAECSVICFNTTDVAYVDGTAGGPGTLGNPADPFVTLQAGVDAVPPTGGLVLVAGGTYNALTALTDAGAVGSTIGVYGSFTPASFTAGATPESILNTFDDVANAAIVNGVGIDPTLVIGQVGHFDVRNMGRQTFIGGMTFEDNEAEVLVGGLDANVQFVCCTFRDSLIDDVSPFPSAGFLTTESAPTQRQRITAVGCLCDEIGNCFDLMGGFELFKFGGNRVTDCTQWISALTTSVDDGANLRIYLDCNDIARILNSGFDIEPEATVIAGTGTVDVRIHGNRFVGINTDSEIGEFGSHGNGAALNFMVADNFFGPVDSSAIDIDWLPNVSTDDEFLASTTTTVTFRNNTFSLMNSETIDLQDCTPGMGGAFAFVVEDTTIVQCDSEAIESDPSNPGAATFNQDGASWANTFQRCTAVSCDGFYDGTQRIYRGGSSTTTVRDCLLDGMTDEPCEAIIEQFTTAVTALANDSQSNGVLFRDNTVYGADESSLEIVDVRQTITGDSFCHVFYNTTWAGEETVDSTWNFEPGLNATLDFRFVGNHCRQADDDNVLDCDMGGTAGGTIYAEICNNDMRSGRDIVEFDNFGNTADLVGFVTFTHNYLSDCTEGEAVDIEFNDGFWSVLVARNVVVGNGDDGEEAMEFGGATSLDGGLFLVRNNLCVSSGGGIEADRPYDALQFINNTVAFSGQGFNGVLGSDDGPNSPCYVHNCISHGNEGEDISNESFATYSVFEDAPASAGFGSFLGDPIFRREGTIVTPNTWFQLSPASPARDGGDPAAEYNDPDGTRNDAGAFGGPGAGTLGTLATPMTPCPLYLVGFSPMVDLHASARFLPAGATPVDLVFNHPINAATANTGTIAVTSNGSAVAGTFTVMGRRVRFTPTGGWSAGERVMVQVNTGLQNTDGTALNHLHTRHFAIAPAGATNEAEANDTSGTANPLAGDPVESVAGALASDLDVDFYSFTGTAGDRLQASLFGNRIAVTGVDWGLRLYAADGTTILFDSTGSLNEDDPFIDFTLPTSGTYFLEVYDQGSGVGAGPFNYNINIWFQ